MWYMGTIETPFLLPLLQCWIRRYCRNKNNGAANTCILATIPFVCTRRDLTLQSCLTRYGRTEASDHKILEKSMEPEGDPKGTS